MSATNEHPRVRTVILGAAGRDFHDFNLLYRDDPFTEVVAFTAAQIPDIDGRRYPPALAGPRYPDGIPIVAEDTLETLIVSRHVQRAVFAYSDVSHAHVMTLAQRCLALGAEFVLPGPERTMLRSTRPVVSVCAVRTGCGKSALARWIAGELKARGRQVAVIRHPMPYGDLARQAVQRFATRADLDAAGCTAEEREEYEPHLEAGHRVFAGVDYLRVLMAAEAEADVIVWDGGNNDFPFVRPDLRIVVVDGWRPEQARGWHPGEAVLRAADLVVISKTDTAPPEAVEQAEREARARAPKAPIVRGLSRITLDAPDAVRGRRVLAIEDGPTLTHGGMSIGAGAIAARAAGAELVDPRPFAPQALRARLAVNPNLGPVLPMLGYSPTDLDLMARTIAATPADVIVAGTPIDLAALVPSDRPVVRARYAFSEAREGSIAPYLDALLRKGAGRR
jgi:predicted GTPase